MHTIRRAALGPCIMLLAASCDSPTRMIDTTPHDLTGESDLAVASGTCSDGITNGSETDTDCGGASCPKCATGRRCRSGLDCANKVCSGLCQPPSCNDGAQNGGESDIDCGGGLCRRCADGRMCAASSDCVLLDCVRGVCGGVPAGDGGVRDGA